MKELVEVIAKSLVDYPEQVIVDDRQTRTHCESNSYCSKSRFSL